jgi:hypothetical protein
MANILDLTKARQVKILGGGADGVARLFSKGQSKYVVKTLKIRKGKVVDMDTAEELENEREQHLALWAKLRSDEKQYFFEPYIAQLDPAKYPGPNHVMNYIPGLSTASDVGFDLYKKSKDGTPQDAANLKSFVRKIQKAVLAMWRTGMVHADLHLGNVMVNRDASIVKVIDFGRSSAANSGLNITKNNLTSNHFKNPPPEWKKWFDKSIGAWDKLYRNSYGGGNPEGYVFGMTNKNKFFAKSSYNAFTWFRGKVNTNAKFKSIPKPTTPKSLPKKTKRVLEPVIDLVKQEEKKLPKLADRIAKIAKKARANQKKEALDKIKREFREQKRKCKKDAKGDMAIAKQAVDKKFGLTPELRKKAIIRANKVNRMIAIRKSFVQAARNKKNIANRKKLAAQKYLPKPVISPAKKKVPTPPIKKSTPKESVIRAKINELIARGNYEQAAKMQSIRKKLFPTKTKPQKSPARKPPTPLKPNRLPNHQIGRNGLKRYTIPELKRLARSKNIRGFSKYTRGDNLRAFLGKQVFPTPKKKSPTPIKKKSPTPIKKKSPTPKKKSPLPSPSRNEARAIAAEATDKFAKVLEQGIRTFKSFALAEASRIIHRRFRTLTGGKCYPISSFQLNPKSWDKVNLKPDYWQTTTNVNKSEYGIGNNSITPPVYPVMGMLFTIMQYQAKKVSMHSIHATAAIKYGDTLFYFNAWGKNSLRKDKQLAEAAKKYYGANKVISYSGPSLQRDDNYGVCGGYASNFVLEMFLRIKSGTVPEIIKSQRAFNSWVNTTLRKRGICYGGKCVPTCGFAGRGKFHKSMFNNLIRPIKNATPLKITNMSNKDMKNYAKRRFGRVLTREELNALHTERNKELRKLL